MNWFVDRVVADKWAGVLCDEVEIQAPTLEDVLRAIAALDAATHTMVSLFGSESCLCIGGGAGQYVAYASLPDGRLWNLLLDNEERKEVVLLNAGGQEGDFPGRQVVDKLRVLHAARTFFETGALDTSLRWEVAT